MSSSDPFRSVRVLALLVLLVLVAPTAGAAGVAGGSTAGAAAGLIRVPVALSGGDTDGLDAPFDRCPDRGEKGDVDEEGCPIDPLDRFGDVDEDGLMNGRSLTVAPESPLREYLVRAGIVGGILRDGRWFFFGEESVGTDPRDPNTDRFDRFADGFEVAMKYGLTPAARVSGTFAHVVQGDGVPLGDPLVPDAYLDLHPTILGNRTYWNDALEAAVEQVVADDWAPEGNASYTPPGVRLHVFVEDSLPLADPTLTTEEVLAEGEAARVRQYLAKERFPVATFVVAAPAVTWDGAEVAGLAFDRFVLVALDHKGFEACHEAGGDRDAAACQDLGRLFRWTLNHERFHHFGLADTVGENTLMSTAPGVHAPRPAESAARFAFLERTPLVDDWK